VLAREISIALSDLTAIDLRRTETALSAAKTPLDQARAVSRTILAQITAPLDARLVIDDYHLLTPGSGGEALIGLLEASGRFRLMIASRERPVWATSRRFVHLDLVELGLPTWRSTIKRSRNCFRRRPKMLLYARKLAGGRR